MIDSSKNMSLFLMIHICSKFNFNKCELNYHNNYLNTIIKYIVKHLKNQHGTD